MRKLLAVIVTALLIVGSAPKFSHAIDDGTPSTGSFTIVTNSKLAAASASGTLTVADVTSLAGTAFYVGPFQFVAGRDYTVGASVNATATNIAAAINAFVPYGPQAGLWVTAAANSAVVTVTGISAGSAYNALSLKTSNGSEISVSGAALTGGQDNATVTINGVTLAQGRDWFALDVASNTALSVSAAINNSAALKRLVSGYTQGTGLITLRSLLTPAAYPISATDNSANNANISVSGATMTGGSAGQLANLGCYLGPVNALPTSGYPQGCFLTLNSDATHIYVSTQAVTGAANAAANSWLAK